MEIFTKMFDSELFALFLDMFLISIIVAVISALFTESMKISYEKAFSNHKQKPAVSWITNFLSNIILSILFVYLFNPQTDNVTTIIYTAIVAFLAWILSILTYSLIIRLFIIGSNILYTKAKDYLVDSETDLISSTLLKNKQEELLNAQISLDKLKVMKKEKNKKEEK